MHHHAVAAGHDRVGRYSAAGEATPAMGRYTREQQVLTLPEAIYKMTALSANRFHLHDRGRIAVGQIADLVVLDAAQVIDGQPTRSRSYRRSASCMSLWPMQR